MAIPLNEVPNYICTLPSNGQKVTYRPFLVKEEKVMLMALESEDETEIGHAVVNTVQSCIITELDVTKLPIFDFEYLYLKVRAKSVGEIVKLRLKCPDDEKEIVSYDLNLEEIKVETPKGQNFDIKFENNYGVVMSYPTIKSFNGQATNTEVSLDVLKDSIESIYKGEEVYDRNNISAEELEQYVGSLTQAQYKQLINFFDKMPRIKHTIKYKNPKTDKEFNLTLNGTRDFFQ